MPGLLYPAYQKLYSALSHLERFDKEANFFDNISAIDGFFNEYRNITFVIQASLKHTDYINSYEKNRTRFLKDHWFVEKRNETIKQAPFALVKEVRIVLYLPYGGFTISENTFTVENDEPLEKVFTDIKSILDAVDAHEVCFSVSFSFHEAESNTDLLQRMLNGISSMKEFMDAMDHDVGEQCPLCSQLRAKINELHTADIPLDFLLTNDYTYYPEKDCYDKAERVSMMLSLDGKKVASRQPLSGLTQAKHFNFDGTAFGNFTLMHAMLRTLQPGLDIMPAIMVVFDDDTYDLDAFNATMKTTMYRKLNETARLVETANVTEVCYVSLYAVVALTPDAPRTSHERIAQSTTDILICASVDKELNEKEYVFDGTCMERIEYVAHIMKNGLKRELGASAINLSPIKRAFKAKKSSVPE